MTVELPILYRVAEGGPFDIQVDNGVTIENITDDLVNAKILIPDIRLQTIINAWSNLKMVTGERAIPLVATGLRETVRRAIPELATAIEAALTEENNEREPKQGTGLPDPSECPYCAECRPMGMTGCLGHYPEESNK